MEGERRAMSFNFWYIENFRYSRCEVGECLTSRSFQIDGHHDYWRVCLYPRGTLSAPGFVSIYLHRNLENDQGPHSITVDYYISLCDINLKPILTQNDKNRAFTKGLTSGFPMLARREDVIGAGESIFLPKGNLTVQIWIQSKAELVDDRLGKPLYNSLRSTIPFQNHLFTWDVGKFTDTFPSEPLLLKGEIFDIWLRLTRDSVEVHIKLKEETKMTRCKIGIVDSSKAISQFRIDEYMFHLENPTFDASLISRSELFANRDLYLPDGCLMLHGEYHFTFGNCRHEVLLRSFDMDFNHYLSENTGWENPENAGCENPENADCEDEGSENLDCCDNNHDSLRYDLQNFYQEETLKDFSIQIGTETLKVHKAILLARSDYFRAMVIRNFAEGNKDKVVIQGRDMEMVRRIVKFIYTDKVDVLDWNMAFNLHIEADYWSVMELKSICAEFLRMHMTAANAEDISRLPNPEQDLKELARVLQKR